MCDSSGRLVAWMDGELAENESADVERHVQGCAECRRRVDAYGEVSRGFAAYYARSTRTPAKSTDDRKFPRWVPVAAAAAAAAVAAMVMFALLTRSAEPVPLPPQVAAVAPATVPEITKTVPMPAQRRHVAAHRAVSHSNLALAQPAIQIAIPAEAMFPPGAVPEGLAYIANLSFSADGSVQGVRLQQ